jgi:hypothetical protein
MVQGLYAENLRYLANYAIRQSFEPVMATIIDLILDRRSILNLGNKGLCISKKTV